MTLNLSKILVNAYDIIKLEIWQTTVLVLTHTYIANSTILATRQHPIFFCHCEKGKRKIEKMSFHLIRSEISLSSTVAVK